MISFGAKYLFPATVQKVAYKDAKITPAKVSFVELDPMNEKDLEAVYNVSLSWEAPDLYPEMIHSYMSYCASEYNEDEGKNTKFYALTSQKKNLEAPEPDDILALAQVNTANGVEIEYIQAKPESPMDSFFKKYKFSRVGTGMLDSLKKVFKGEQIFLYSNPRARGFYKKNGFKEYPLQDKFVYDA